MIILQELTGSTELNCLALNNWTNVISPRALLKENLSWCPLCIEEIKEKRDVYYPLLWYLKEIQHCTLHNIPLCEKCPNCDKLIPALHRKMINGYCPYCRSSLVTYQPQTDVTMIDLDNFIIEEIKYLIQYSPNISSVFEKGFVNKRLNILINQATSGNPADLRKKIQIPKVTFYGWLRENRLPQFDSLIKICYSLGISLFTLLNQDFVAPLLLREVPLNVSNKVTKSKRKLDYVQIQEELLEFLKQDPPLSMKEVANKIKINKRMLYQNLPNLAKQISARYSCEIKKRKKEREKKIYEDILKSVIELKKRNIKPTQRNIEELLDDRGILREKYAKSARLKIIKELEEDGKYISGC